MSDTPRTDQYVKMRASLAYCVERDTSDFARILERELAKVTKQRDELVKAIRGHKSAIAFTLSDFDELLYKALEELEEGECAVSLSDRIRPNSEAAPWVCDEVKKIERELAEVTNQRDVLIEGLERLASCDWVITLPDRMDAVRKIARETLNKIQP